MKALMTAFLAWSFLTTWNLQAASIDWVREYNGPGNDPDRVAAIAAAPDGGIVVAGTSTVAGTQEDIAVVKFAPSGDTVWTRYVDCPTANSETCIALTIDSEGNIVVAGTTYSTATERDFLVAKLNMDGELMWLRTFDGVAHAEDQLSAVETDIAGNVYVTGSSATTLGWPALEDYATIKYSSTGEELWVRFYNGGGEGDLANDVDVDTAGNVYVTGRSNTSPVIPGVYCATVKYRPDGTTDWVRTAYDAAPNTYGAGRELEIDDMQNIYVAATLSEGFSNYAMVVKYNPEGDTLWQRVHLRSLSRWDSVADMALAPGGGVVIAGSGTDVFTVRYTASGDTLWSRQWSQGLYASRQADALTLDAVGNVFVSGYFGASTDFHQVLTLGYSAAGDSLFVCTDSIATYTRGEGKDIAIDSSGNLYTACLIATPSLEDIALMRYNSSGLLTWKERYSGPGSASDYASDIVVDALGYSYVTGYSCDLSCDMVTIKYSPSGRQEWRETYDGPLGGDDRATAAVLDHSGNLVVVGAVSTALSTSGDSFYDYLIVKYNADGDTLWVRTYDGGGSYPSDDATAVVVDAADNIYVTGDSYGISEDYLTLKYGPAGNLIWSDRFNGSGGGEDHAKALAVDKLGNVYITGNSDGGMENDDIVTVMYNTEGIRQWVNRYDGPPGEDEDGGEAIAIGPDGLACVAGWSPSLSTGEDIMVLKYTAAGDTTWTRRIDGAVHTRDVGNALAIDELGNLYVGGSVGIGSSGCTYEAKNATVIKFAPDGQLLWSWFMDNAEPCSDAVRELTVDSSGSVFAVGSSGYPGSYTWEDYHRMLSVKISAAGELVWFDEHEGSAAGQAGGVALALDPSGNLLVTGTTSGIGSDQDITTIKIRRSNFCGDVNGSGAVSISDAVYLIKYIFGGGPAPSPILAGDVNCSGAVSISDAVYLINYIFAGGAAPCAACP